MTEIGRSGNVKLTEDQLKDIRGKMLQSEDIADAVLYVLSTPPSVQVTKYNMRKKTLLIFAILGSRADY